MTLARLPILAAVLLAALLARPTPRHYPIALALAGALLVDLVRDAVALAPRPSMALYLLTPALSAWCALRVLARLRPDRAALALVAWLVVANAVLFAPSPSLWWAPLPGSAHVTALVVELSAAAAWWRSNRRGTISDACVLVLAAGDMVGLLGPAGVVPGSWSLVAAQAAVIGAVLAALQAWAIARTK